jgi:hypothetical protein
MKKYVILITVIKIGLSGSRNLVILQTSFN